MSRKRLVAWIAGALVSFSLLGCARESSAVRSPQAPGSYGPSSRPYETGIASYYHPNLAGRKTANGEIYDPRKLTAAHKTLPFGTIVEVRSKKTGRSVVVRINDRGPFSKKRIIDLSNAAAEQMNMIRAGIIDVELRILSWPPEKKKKKKRRRR